MEGTLAGLDSNIKVNSFAAHFMMYKSIESLTRPMLAELIDRILVHEGGRITLKVKFADAFEAMIGCVENGGVA